MNISIDDLANTITNAVKYYTEDVTTAIEKEVDKTARRAAKLIGSKSPKSRGRYAKGWTRKKVTIGGEVSHTIYNKYKPGLTHLLEKGHAKRGGGRVAGKPHIAPVVDAEIPVMVNKIKSIIRDGG